ncbi:MAG: hypothetical protein WC346_00170 [Methanogenium sp.]|jgi:hypothetical protein
MSSQYGWKIILDGTTDITDKVQSFTIDAALDSFCRELSLELRDVDFYDSLDFSIIPDSPRIEVFTRVTDEYDEYDEYDYAWISQGIFFIEKPTFKVGLNITETGIWGRQSTAILGEPLAPKMTKLWDEDASFYTICQEILELVGLTWDASRCDIANYTIYANSFEAQNQYPIEVLRNLVELVVGEEGFVITDRSGNIWIKRIDRDPTASVYDVTDIMVQSIDEEPTWPDFGNRIKISPPESLSPNSIEISLDSQCLGTDILSINVYAQVSNGSGVPINNEVVTWSFSPEVPESIWYKYPSTGKTAVQNSSEMLVSNEIVTATGFNSVELKFQPREIIGIWAYADKTRQYNFAANGGYVLDGKNVYITDRSFTFCDQKVIVSYYASGMVKNTIMYHPMDETDHDGYYDGYGGYVEPSEFWEEGAEDPYGTLVVIASVSGKEASEEVYINNSCKCPSTLTVEVDPSSISFGSSTVTKRPYDPFTDGNNPTDYEYDVETHQWMVTVVTGTSVETKAKITAYLEQGGMAVAGIINMAELSGFGKLDWTSKATEIVDVTENTEAINAIYGQSQCEVSSVIESVVGVWEYTRDEDTGEDTKIGDNLYESFDGKTIDLNTHVSTGTELLVEYTRGGSVVNYLTPVSMGTARIDVSAPSSAEAGLSQVVQVTIEDSSSTDEESTTPSESYVSGPSSGTYPTWNPDLVNPITPPNNTYHTFGPWFLCKADGTKINFTMSAEGSGYIQVVDNGLTTKYGKSIRCDYRTPAQTIKLTLNGDNGESATRDFSLTKA